MRSAPRVRSQRCKWVCSSGVRVEHGNELASVRTSTTPEQSCDNEGSGVPFVGQMAVPQYHGTCELKAGPTLRQHLCGNSVSSTFREFAMLLLSKKLPEYPPRLHCGEQTLLPVVRRIFAAGSLSSMPLNTGSKSG